MNRAYLLIGGNIGNREENLSSARHLIEQHCGMVLAASAHYETEAWGKSSQPSFLNQALELSTPLNAQELMKELLKIEKMMGRLRNEKYGPRLIDIDILLFNGEQINSPILSVPHPELPNRRFALVPLSEIAPEIVHPVFQKTILQLLQECKDDLAVRKLG